MYPLLLEKKRPIIMGVLNVTPDSFSDGGKFNTVDAAVERVQEMEEQGADIVDIGGESTGPGSENVSAEEECTRVLPVVRAVQKVVKIPLSIDTYKGEVARACLEEGADIINDITALRGDEDMARVVAEKKCSVVLMYAKDDSPRTTVNRKKYDDVVQTINRFWDERVAHALNHGITKEQIILDPGMGHFVSSLPRYSFEIIARLRELTTLEFPVLVGASRKSFLGGHLERRDQKGLIVEALAYLNGARIIRTHNVLQTRGFLDSLLQ